ncbi:Mur ligase family protein [Alphaproteobacteria bacterium]|nr:Mur ligase family protein [Alphaproteobacteria bacterium]
MSLNRIRDLLKKLNNPQDKLPHTIHIAGTNGKGSVATSIYELQRLSGKKVHVYRSPHLISFNERIVVANKIISDKRLYESLSFVYEINNKNIITFFEFFTATAFYIFSKVKADVFICEVGLGGRCDATNIINDRKKSCIITSIGLDHKEYLGNNIKKITYEKAGIIKYSNLLICSKQNKIVSNIIHKKVKQKNCNSFIYGKQWNIRKKYMYFNDQKINLSKLALTGEHQYQNIGCAVLACYKIKALKIDTMHIPYLIEKIKWEGRLHRLNGYIKKNFPTTEYWVDCAHNTLGFQALKKWVEKKKFLKLYIVLSVGIQKDYKAILKQIKKMKPTKLFFIKSTGFSSRSSEDLFIQARNLNIKCKILDTLFDAMKFVSLIKEKKTIKKTCLIVGSTNLVGKALLIDKKN